MSKGIEAELMKECLKDFRKYNDTVVVSAAVCHLFKENDLVGSFMRIEPELKRISESPLTPDLAVMYDNRSKGIVFEMKWSVPRNAEHVEEEIKTLIKYFDTLINWKNDTGKVEWHDVILICHPEDSKQILEIIKKIASEDDYGCFDEIGFSIWTWLYTHGQKGGETEELRLIRIYGQTRNEELERLISPELGYLVSDKVLRYLRFTYFVVKERPPLPYLLYLLIVNVLFQQVAPRYEESYEVTTDWIWNKTKNVILTSEEYEDKSLTIKRRWIRQALDSLVELEIIQKGSKEETWEIPTNLFRYTRKSINEIICEKIAKKRTRLGRARSRPSGKVTKLTDFIEGASERAGYFNMSIYCPTAPYPTVPDIFDWSFRRIIR